MDPRTAFAGLDIEGTVDYQSNLKETLADIRYGLAHIYRRDVQGYWAYPGDEASVWMRSVPKYLDLENEETHNHPIRETSEDGFWCTCGPKQKQLQ